MMFFLEFITLASVPFFVTSVLKPEIVILKFNDILNYQPDSFFEDNLILISSIFVIISFLLKNIFLVFLILYQGNFFQRH